MSLKINCNKKGAKVRQIGQILENPLLASFKPVRNALRKSVEAGFACISANLPKSDPNSFWSHGKLLDGDFGRFSIRGSRLIGVNHTRSTNNTLFSCPLALSNICCLAHLSTRSVDALGGLVDPRVISTYSFLTGLSGWYS